jgi:putative transcriptional regulator
VTLLLPTCAEVTALLTDYEDGALDPLHWLGLRLHLGLCPPCRKFLASLHAPLTLLREAWGEAQEPRAEAALGLALAAIREGRIPSGPQYHPDGPLWQALQPGGDALTALILRLHLGQCAACQREYGSEQGLRITPDPLEVLRPYLPPEAQWRRFRHGLGGAEVVQLVQDPHSGASLSLARLPGGRTMPRHGHGGPEQSLVLSGALQDGPAHLCVGDWIAHGPADEHGPAADIGCDCWSLIRLEGGVQFQGWRGLIGSVG